jgi:hypothetical protein
MAVERLLKFEKDRFQPHIETFNQNDSEAEVNVIPNRESRGWIKENIPFFECLETIFSSI